MGECGTVHSVSCFFLNVHVQKEKWSVVSRLILLWPDDFCCSFVTREENSSCGALIGLECRRIYAYGIPEQVIPRDLVSHNSQQPTRWSAFVGPNEQWSSSYSSIILSFWINVTTFQQSGQKQSWKLLWYPCSYKQTKFDFANLFDN